MNPTCTINFWGRLSWLLSALLLLPLLGQAQSANLVISQVYGAGGNANAAYNQDFVELFNRSTSPVTLTGWTIQYAASGAVFGGAANTYALSSATIPAGGYYLVSIGSAGSVGTAIVADQAATSITMGLSAMAGKIALANNAAVVTYTAPNAFSANVVDVVGYGSGTDAYEGSARAGAPANSTLSTFRANAGCTDTNNNGADFASGAASPRSSRTPITAASICPNPVLVANPAALTFSAATGQTANLATYTLAGYNLAANKLVTISSNDASVLVSTTGAAGSFGATASVMTTASGTLMQTITVQFTAPATAGTTNAVLSNSDGTRTATVAVTGAAILAYTWNGSSTSYANATSWTPTRTTPASADILVFDGSITASPTVTVDYVTTQTIGQLVVVAQTIGQLLFSNNVAATLTTDGDRLLTIDNNLPGDDLVLGAGSRATLTNNTTAASAGLAISLTNTETAAIGGTLVFTGNTATTNGQHTLQATGTGAIQFLAGSVFQAASSYSNASPFGSSTANSVVFRNGSRCEQLGGSSPFGTTTVSVATFEPASYFLFGASNSAPALANRTYGTLAYSINSTATLNNPTTIQGDLLVLSGNVNINGTGTINLQGNLQVSSGAALTLGTSSAGPVVQLNGSAAQIIGSSTAPTSPVLGPNATLAINNAAGVTLGVPLAVPGTLQLTSGLLTTTAARLLTLPATATVAAGSDISFVNGPLVRPLSAVGTYVFPVGKGAAYRPVTLNIGAATSAVYYYRAEQFEGNPGQNVAGSNLTRVSSIRSLTISPFASAAEAASTSTASTQPTGFSGTVALSFGSDDVVTDPTQLVVAKRSSAASAWTNQGYSSSTGTATAGTVTSGTFTAFSDFALGTTSATPAVNPLPVVLTNFGAVRQASGVVRVSWATASEQHSAYFEVQRSLDGRIFASVAQVAAQGSTTQAHTYASLDQAAPIGQLYYRLRQANTDGTATFSSVVTLAAAAATPVLYPNPAHGYLALPAAAGEAIQLLNLIGQVIQTAILPASGELSIEALPAGTYLLRTLLNGQPHVLRFTKE
ncbi:MAG: T9SS type A sorting domain-containing protein [Hymenobacter sp.]|nr:MAG: T9SS type A sorting domain-containing protein [Hymenobacter sp.]